MTGGGGACAVLGRSTAYSLGPLAVGALAPSWAVRLPIPWVHYHVCAVQVPID